MVTTRSASGTARSGSWEESSTAGAAGRRLGDQLGQQPAGRRVEPGVGLVEQPQLGGPGHQDGQGHPRRWPAESRPTVVRRRRPTRPRRSRAGAAAAAGQAGRPHGEADVLRRGQLVVEGCGVAEQADLAPDRGPVPAQVVAEDLGLARGDREQTGAGPQQAGLAGAVGADDHDDLPGCDGEIDAGEGGEPTGERDGGIGSGLRGPWPSATCYGARWPTGARAGGRRVSCW